MSSMGYVEWHELADLTSTLEDVLIEIRDLPHGARDEALCSICGAVTRGLNAAAEYKAKFPDFSPVRPSEGEQKT